MSDHLSDFALDGVALSAAAPPEHVAQCSECTARLAAITAHAQAMKSSAAFARVSRSLEQVELKPNRSWLQWAGLAAGLAVAASLALVLRPGAVEPSTERLKGSGDVTLIRSLRVLPSEPFKLGERVTVRVTPSGGATEAVVFSISDDTHQVEQVWPAQPSESAVIPPGGNLADLIITPGSLMLVAVFFDRHASTTEVATALRERGIEAAAANQALRHIEVGQ